MEHMGEVQPLAPRDRVDHEREPHPPDPRSRARDEREALHASLSDEIDVDSLLDTDGELSFCRPGIGPDVIRKLRRGDWSIQAALDLHGHRVEEAREETARVPARGGQARPALRAHRPRQGTRLERPRAGAARQGAALAGAARGRDRLLPGAACRRAARARWWCCCGRRDKGGCPCGVTWAEDLPCARAATRGASLHAVAQSRCPASRPARRESLARPPVACGKTARSRSRPVSPVRMRITCSTGRHEDLAVADLAGARGLHDRLDRALDQRVGHDHLDLDLRQEVDDVLGAAIELGVALLAAETLDFGDGEPGDAGSDSASRTSSSLNGLMIASIFFMTALPAQAALRARLHDWQGHCDRPVDLGQRRSTRSTRT